MNIPPKVSFYLNLVYVILVAIGTGTIAVTGVASADTAKQIVAWAALLSAIINIILHGYSAPQPGPLVPVTPDSPVKK